MSRIKFVLDIERRICQIHLLQEAVQNIIDQFEIISKDNERNKDIDKSMLDLSNAYIRLDDEVNKDIHFRKTSKIVSECTNIAAMAIQIILDQ